MEPYHTVLLLVCDLLPPNAIAVAVRRVNRAFHQRYADDTAVDCKSWLPLWAVQEGWDQAGRRSDRRYGQLPPKRFGDAVVHSGDLGNLEWLLARGVSWDGNTYFVASYHGHVDVVRWALQNGCPSTVPEGGLVFTQRLGGKVVWSRRFYSTAKACCTWVAAFTGEVEMLMCLATEGMLDRDVLCMGAAQGGQLFVLHVARACSPPCPWGAAVCSQAAQSGQLEALQWLRAHGCPWDKSVCAYAALSGHLALLQWARENGCPWDASTCQAAGENGDLAVLQWARAHGCPWDEATCEAACALGHVALLQWARSQELPCPWDATVTLAAATAGQADALRWALDNGCPCHKDVYYWVRHKRLPVRLPGLRRYCVISRSIKWGGLLACLAGTLLVINKPRIGAPLAGAGGVVLLAQRLRKL